MNGKTAAEELRADRRFLHNCIDDFTAADEHFRPTPEMMTVAQQVFHIANTIEWFEEGVFGSGFDMDFAKHMTEQSKPWTLADATSRLEKAYDSLIARVEPMTGEQLAAPMRDNPILGATPYYHCVSSTIGHNCHHRGALTVYLRLLGRVPKMVYS